MAKKCGKRRKLIAFVASVLMFLSGSAFAGCLSFGGNLLESLNCLGLPTIDKYYQPTVFKWNDKEILVVNRGNELSFFNITNNPASPVPILSTQFRVGNQGDSDHDLTAFSVCDNCRFGVAAYKRGVVLFDLGTGALPSNSGFRFYLKSGASRVAYTYKGGVNQYAISADLPGGLGGMFDSSGTIFRIVSSSNAVPTYDFLVPAGWVNAPVTGGFDRGEYLMLSLNGSIVAYRKSGDNLLFVRDTGMKATMSPLHAMDVSGNLAVTGQSGSTVNGLKLWNITDPLYPSLLNTYPGRYRSVGFAGQFIVVSDNSDNPVSFEIVNNQIQILDLDFWNDANPWNQLPSECTFANGSAFKPNGMWAYVSRYSVVQKVNFTGCAAPPTPTPTPTPTPPVWPPTTPTCVPGCIPQQPTCVPGCIPQ